MQAIFIGNLMPRSHANLKTRNFHANCFEYFYFIFICTFVKGIPHLNAYLNCHMQYLQDLVGHCRRLNRKYSASNILPITFMLKET